MKIKCGLESCDVMITPSKRQIPHVKRGNDIFCCNKHKNQKHLARFEAKITKNMGTRHHNHDAQKFAALNCILHSQCRDDAAKRDDEFLPCLKCQTKVIEMGAWMREPGALYHNQDDYHSVCLPRSQ